MQVDLALPAGAPAQFGFDPERFEHAWRVLEAGVDRGDAPGAVAAVLRGTTLVGLYAYGFAQTIPDEAKRPVNIGTIFDLASLTKVVATTPVILRLVEQGKIYLNQHVADILPLFKEHSGEGLRDITVKNLLAHTSGLAASLHLRDNEDSSMQISAADAIKRIASLSPAYETGTQAVYSDLGFILLGTIAESVTGTPFDQLARELIFEPLGMRETYFCPDQSLYSRIAASEQCRWRKRMIVGEVHDENAASMGGVAGHAGLFSTAGDLARYAAALIDDGRSILSPATVRAMQRDATSGLPNTRGLGWALRNAYGFPASDLFSPQAYGHTGFTGTSIVIDPGYNLAVILLTNRVHPTRENMGIVRMRATFHNAVVSALRVLDWPA